MSQSDRITREYLRNVGREKLEEQVELVLMLKRKLDTMNGKVRAALRELEEIKHLGHRLSNVTQIITTIPVLWELLNGKQEQEGQDD